MLCVVGGWWLGRLEMIDLRPKQYRTTPNHQRQTTTNTVVFMKFRNCSENFGQLRKTVRDWSDRCEDLCERSRGWKTPMDTNPKFTKTDQTLLKPWKTVGVVGCWLSVVGGCLLFSPYAYKRGLATWRWQSEILQSASVCVRDNLRCQTTHAKKCDNAPAPTEQGKQSRGLEGPTTKGQHTMKTYGLQ